MLCHSPSYGILTMHSLLDWCSLGSNGCLQSPLFRKRAVQNFHRLNPCLFLLAALAWQYSVCEAKPNIVFFLADDLGWTDTSVGSVCLGNASDFYQTPHLENLAAQGMAFSCAYAAGANCAPTRAALLTGQYAPRTTNHVYSVGHLNRAGRTSVPLRGAASGLPTGEDQIPSSAITLAETLKGAGYTTAHFGKYHIGNPASSSLANGPLQQGFDANFGGNGTGNPGGTYFANRQGVFASPNIGPELDAYASAREHLTDATTDAALDFLAGNCSNPFYMHVAYHAPHTPIRNQGRPDLVARYAAKQDGKAHRNDDYAALVEGVDQGVGRILKFLNTTKDPNHPGQMLAANTLVIFTSDNGGFEGPTENSPLKGQKGEYTEGGLRVPMIAAYPGNIPSGTVNATPVSTVDFYPTLAAMAQANLPADYPLDGEDLSPILADPSASLARDALFWHFPGYLIGNGRNQRPQTLMRKDVGARQWKIIYSYENQSWELYDLAADIGEANNLASSEPAVLAELGVQLRNWLVEIEAELPTDAQTGKPVALPRVAPAAGSGSDQAAGP